MIKEYQNKQIGNKDFKQSSKYAKKATKYYFPTHKTTVEAESLDEATAKLKTLLKNKKQ